MGQLDGSRTFACSCSHCVFSDPDVVSISAAFWGDGAVHYFRDGSRKRSLALSVDELWAFTTSQEGDDLRSLLGSWILE